MAVANGQLANQTTFNTAFVSRTVDTSTVGKLDLQNAASESGTSITNTQRELNAVSSYTGKALNVAKDILPAWTNNDIGASGNNLFQRANLLTAEFNSSTGHSHSGAAGEAPPINLATSVNGFLPLANAGLGTNSFNQNAIIYLSGLAFTSGQGYFAASGTKFGMYTDSPSAGFDLNSTLSLRQENSGVSGDVTALSFDKSLVRFSQSPTIHGISSSGVENSFLFLMNASSSDILISNESASASVSNQVITGTGENFTFEPGGMAMVAYDKTSSKWRLMGGGGSDSSSGSINTDSSDEMSNVGLDISVSSNIITVALKTKTGSNPSGSSPVNIGFRDATATNGVYNQRVITSALSLTLGTAVSLGAKTAVANEFIIYAFDNAGTITLGASLLQLDEKTLRSSSTTGTSNAVIYQASALSTKPVRILGRFKATWTTAVGWSAITEVSVGYIPYRKLSFRGYLGNSQTIAQNTLTTVNIDTVEWDLFNCFDTTTHQFTALKAMKVRASGKVTYGADTLAGQRYNAIIGQNVTGKAVSIFDIIAPTGTGSMGTAGGTTFNLAAGDTLEIRTSTAHVATNTLSTGSDATYFDIEEV